MYNTYQLPLNQYSFDLTDGCTINDGSHIWGPQNRYDFIVPLFNFSVDIGYNQMEINQLIEYAVAEIPDDWSTTTGDLIKIRSEVYNRKGELFISSKYPPYIARSRNKPEPGDDIRHREVRIAGHLEHESGVVFARCDTLEFK